MRYRMITLQAAKDEIIRKCQVCYVAMVSPEGEPYVIPFNFGYDGEYIYLHSAPKGKKISILEHNPSVCIAFSTDHELYHQSEKMACSYGMKYRSVLVYGIAEFLHSEEEKISALNQIMKQYTHREDYDYGLPSLHNVSVYRIRIERMDARVFGY